MVRYEIWSKILLWFRNYHRTFVFRVAHSHWISEVCIDWHYLLDMMMRLRSTWTVRDEASDTLLNHFRVDVPTFSNCWKHKYTFAALADQVKDALWLQLNTGYNYLTCSVITFLYHNHILSQLYNNRKQTQPQITDMLLCKGLISSCLFVVKYGRQESVQD